jgi:homocysteine S-methyltransferase
MSTHAALPQLGESIFLTDGGIETDLIFNEGIDLPHFASIVLVDSEAGRRALIRYFEKFLTVAREAGRGFILESPTWRASRDWAKPLGYTTEALARANERAIELMIELRAGHQRDATPIVISGCVGPRGDGYMAGDRMTAAEARSYHDFQIASFARSGADMVTAITMTYPEEAVGIVQAASERGLPTAISFTTETDGRLPSGEGLAEAIERVDAETDNGPAYYMINCAHPDHFAPALTQGERWAARIRGLRANASRMSHAELDEADQLDAGDPLEFGSLYGTLRRHFPQLTVLGGCCGTDHRHIDAVSRACA